MFITYSQINVSNLIAQLLKNHLETKNSLDLELCSGVALQNQRYAYTCMELVRILVKSTSCKLKVVPFDTKSGFAHFSPSSPSLELCKANAMP